MGTATAGSMEHPKWRLVFRLDLSGRTGGVQRERFWVWMLSQQNINNSTTHSSKQSYHSLWIYWKQHATTIPNFESYEWYECTSPNPHLVVLLDPLGTPTTGEARFTGASPWLTLVIAAFKSSCHSCQCVVTTNATWRLQCMRQKKRDQENLIAVFVEHVNGLKFWVCCHFRTIRSNCGVLQKRQIGLPKVWIHSAFAQQFLAKFHHGPVPWPGIVLPVFFTDAQGKSEKNVEKMWKIGHGLF